MAGRKRNSAGDLVRKLRRADEFTAAGKTQDEIAAALFEPRQGSCGPSRYRHGRRSDLPDCGTTPKSGT